MVADLPSCYLYFVGPAIAHPTLRIRVYAKLLCNKLLRSVVRSQFKVISVIVEYDMLPARVSKLTIELPIIHCPQFASCYAPALRGMPFPLFANAAYHRFCSYCAQWSINSARASVPRRVLGLDVRRRFRTSSGSESASADTASSSSAMTSSAPKTSTTMTDTTMLYCDSE